MCTPLSMCHKHLLGLWHVCRQTRQCWGSHISVDIAKLHPRHRSATQSVHSHGGWHSCLLPPIQTWPTRCNLYLVFVPGRNQSWHAEPPVNRLPAPNMTLHTSSHHTQLLLAFCVESRHHGRVAHTVAGGHASRYSACPTTALQRASETPGCTAAALFSHPKLVLHATALLTKHAH